MIEFWDSSSVGRSMTDCCDCSSSNIRLPVRQLFGVVWTGNSINAARLITSTSCASASSASPTLISHDDLSTRLCFSTSPSLFLHCSEVTDRTHPLRSPHASSTGSPLTNHWLWKSRSRRDRPCHRGRHCLSTSRAPRHHDVCQFLLLCMRSGSGLGSRSRAELGLDLGLGLSDQPACDDECSCSWSRSCSCWCSCWHMCSG